MSAVDFTSRGLVRGFITDIASNDINKGASIVGLKGGGAVQDLLLNCITPQMKGALGDGVADDTSALGTVQTLNDANEGTIYLPMGTYLASAPFGPRNRGICGQNRLSVLKAGIGFASTMNRDYYNTSSPGGSATFSSALFAPTPEAGGVGRNPIENFSIDCNSLAPTGLYLGLTAEQTVRSVNIIGSTGAPVILDALQNSNLDLHIDHAGGPVRLLNGIANCRIHFNASNLTDRALEIEVDTTYPGYNSPVVGGIPRQVVLSGIWERFEGTPVSLVSITGADQITFDAVEVTVSQLTTSRASFTSIVNIVNSTNIKWQGGKINGTSVDDFPNTMSIVDIDGNMGSSDNQIVFEHVSIEQFNNTSGPPLRAMFRHRNTARPLLVRRLLLPGNANVSMLIESDVGNAIYEPIRSHGTWAQRPAEWIDAKIEYFNTTIGQMITKAAARVSSSTSQAAHTTGQTSIQVTSGVRSNAIVGDLFRIALDDGSWHITTLTGTTTSPNAVTMADALPSDAASGNELNICGRWYRSNGLYYFGEQTYTDGDATPLVAGMNYLAVTNTGAKTITNFLKGQVGQRLVIHATDANTTIANNSTIVTRTGANLAMAARDHEEFVYCSDSKWRQLK